MSYTLYKLTESQGKGSPEDESESWTNKISYELVDEKKATEFAEWCADQYGNQDYSWQFSCNKVAVFYDLDAAKDAAKTMLEAVKKFEDELVNEVITTYETDQYGDVIEVQHD